MSTLREKRKKENVNVVAKVNHQQWWFAIKMLYGSIKCVDKKFYNT